MQSATINGQTIDLEVIPEGEATPLEVDAVARLDAALRADARFQAQYPNARLERVDSMRALRDDEDGRYYLRYSSSSGMTEFWGHTAAHATLNMARGIVAVQPVNPEPRASMPPERSAPDSNAVRPAEPV
jgi:hypothetical protein